MEMARNGLPGGSSKRNPLGASILEENLCAFFLQPRQNSIVVSSIRAVVVYAPSCYLNDEQLHASVGKLHALVNRATKIDLVDDTLTLGDVFVGGIYPVLGRVVFTQRTKFEGISLLVVVFLLCHEEPLFGPL